MTNRKAPLSLHEHLSDVPACGPRTDIRKVFLQFAAARRGEVSGAQTLKRRPDSVKPGLPISGLEH